MLADLCYTAHLKPGVMVVDEFYPDRKPKTVRLIQAVDEMSEGYFRIRFADGGSTHSLGDERWERA